ncbi:MAG: SDR family oxidoreductase [Actinobacteria bacterium]|nr:SDR family oxidoreductase [Actinomycetota bacterium]
MELEGKQALVTGAGATGGIGFEIARRFIDEGAVVLITGRDPSRGAEAAAALGDRATFLLADLVELEALARLVDAAGEVDILVNNATAIGRGNVVDRNIAGLDEVHFTNVRAPYVLTAGLAPGMVSRQSGCVVNISSLVAGRGTPGMGSYAASKAALESLTQTWAAELGGSGVRVNAVAPGPIRSAKNLTEHQDELEEFGKVTPLRRTGATAEIAEVVAFLASDRSSYVTGTVIPVDGGSRAI